MRIPGTIRLVTVIELTRSNDPSETPYRAAIPLNVSPDRTTCVDPDELVVGDGDGRRGRGR